MIALIALGKSVSKLGEMSGLRTLDSGQTADQVAALSKLVPSGPVVLSISHWFCQYLFTKYLQSKTSKRKDPSSGHRSETPSPGTLFEDLPLGDGMSGAMSWWLVFDTFHILWQNQLSRKCM